MKYDRTVLAYHGCDAEVAARILGGQLFNESQNDYDWLGKGTYFWEYGPERARNFANEQRARGKVSTPAIVGAVIQLGRCFDLMDIRFTAELSAAYEIFSAHQVESNRPMPENRGALPDRKRRMLDCAVINFYLAQLAAAGNVYDTVRCGFVEGPPAFEGSGIFSQSHVQLAVRNPACIVGVFRPY